MLLFKYNMAKQYFTQLQDKEWLQEQYVNNGRTYDDIAEEIGCTKHGVYHAIKRFGIQSRKRISKYAQLNDKDWLRRMYLDELLSTKQIAALVGSTEGNVHSALTVMGIKTRGYKEGWAARFPDGRFGDAAANWKGGYPICEVCLERTKRRDAVRCKSCEGLNKVGANNVNWKGGITPENVRIRSSKEYIAWRNAVFERDDYTCRFCGARSGKGDHVVINADHIKPFAYFPELRLDLNNGRTLCEPCHKKTDTYAGRIKRYAIDNNLLAA